MKQPKKPGKGKKGAGRRPGKGKKHKQKPGAKPPAQQQPTPPVATNQTTDGSKSTCPAAVRHPCDVTSLKVTVLPKKRGDSTDDPESGKVVIQVPKAMRTPDLAETARLKKIFGKEIALLLQRYDFVIETVASFQFQGSSSKGSNPPETTIDIEAEAEWEGKCATQEHPRMHMRPVTTPGAQLVKVTPPAPPHPAELVPTALTWPVGVKKVQMEGIQALVTPADLFMGQDAVTTLFRIFFFVMSMNQSVDLELWADAHGEPVDPARKPNKNLNGLVRIFRDSQVGIAVTIPLGKKVTEDFGPGEKLDHTKPGPAIEGKSVEKDYRTGMKHEQPLNDHGWSFGKLEKMDGRQYSIAFKLNEFEIALKEEEESLHEVKKRLYDENKKRIGEAASKVKHAGQRAALEARLAYELSDFLSLADYLAVAWYYLVKGIKGVRHVMQEIVDFCKKAPQLGWSLEYELTFLAVGASLTCSRKSSSKVVEQRVVPLKWNGKIELKLTVVEVKARLKFGFMVDLWAVRAEAIVYLEIGGAVEAKFEASLLDDTKIGLEGKVTGRAGAKFQLRIGWKLIHKEIAIEAGFVTEGGATWKGTEKKLELEFKMRTLPVQWYVVATNERTGQVEAKYHTLCKPKTICTAKKTWEFH